MSTRGIHNGIVLSFLFVLLLLGVRSLIIEDSRFGWGMFKNQVDYRVSYSLVDGETGKKTTLRTGSELNRSKSRMVSSRGPRRTRYGIGAVRYWIRKYLEYRFHSELRGEGDRIEAFLVYRINLAGDEISERITYPRVAS